ncbi:cell division protein ZipA [Paraglaciecola sp.]|uniref:cell division protein ZipA n=1 Tax=Paraglaciecola sp. TaxID=1920173 RepID=UPI0030F466A8
MEDDVFRWVLLALGSFIITALAVHGIWVSRKNNKKKESHNAVRRPMHKPQLQPGGWQEDDEWQSDDENAQNLQTGSATDDDFDFKIDFSQDDMADSTKGKNKTSLGPGEFDDLGIGAVRVVGSKPATAKPAKIEPVESESAESEIDDMPSLADFEPSDDVKTPEPKPVSSGKVYASVVTQPKPEYAGKYAHTSSSAKSASGTGQHKNKDNYQAPEPPPFLLKADEKPALVKHEVDVDALKQTAKESMSAPVSSPVVQNTPEKMPEAMLEKVSLAEQARNLVMGKKADLAAKKRKEPKIADDQMRIDFDDKVAAQTPETEGSAKSKTVEVEQEVLVLNVKTAENSPIQGAALLPMLLTLGFKFGDQDIFHRHVNSNGKGPVLFSLANMFKPGNFNIDNLENFTTHGISLFMILPIEGDPHQVFNMMHNAARKIADEFSAQVYDGRRTLLTKQSLQQYVEKIREFERKRMVHR